MPIPVPDDPPLVDVPSTQVLWRVHHVRHAAVWYGRAGDKRFDDPARGFGVLYLAESTGAAVLETLVRGAARRVVDEQEWNQRAASAVFLDEPLRMLRLEGPGLPRFGIGAERVHAGGYGECQALAAEVHATLPGADGIQYRSRWNNAVLCWAVFERAAHKIRGVGAPHPLRGSAVGNYVLDEYAIQLV